MQKRGDWPKRGQASGQVTNGSRSSMTATCPIDNVHLLHQLIVRKVGKSPLYFGIVEGKSGETPFSIEARQSLDLPATEIAVTVIDHNIRVRPDGRVR